MYFKTKNYEVNMILIKNKCDAISLNMNTFQMMYVIKFVKTFIDILKFKHG